MTEYYNFKEGLTSKGQLLSLAEINAVKKNPEKDYYRSIYKYTPEQKKQFEETGTLAGIKDVKASCLVWDFDSKADPKLARTDVLTLGTRLIETYGVDSDNIKCYFSGGKGFHVVVDIDREVSPEQFKKATTSLAEGLETFDSVVSDPNRIFRLENTRHQTSGLYKIPLHISQVDEMAIEDIKEMAKNISFNHFDAKPVKLADELFKVKEKKEKLKTEIVSLDLTKKPRGWQDYVYAILEGHYGEGDRHNALMVLAAKCRAMGYDKEQTYYLCKSSLKKQAKTSGQDEFDRNELWKNIIEKSIYSDRWEGGSYSPKNNEWLRNYCKRLGIKVDYQADVNVSSVGDAFSTFENFAINIDALTIKTGIPELDENLRLTVGMSAGMVAPPGVGKTSFMLQMLNNMSNAGEHALFFSYDMYAAILYQKMVQKHFDINSKILFDKFKNDPKFRSEVKEKLANEYRNVSFCFKTGQTVNEINDTIKEAEDIKGKKVRLIGMDYNELVITDYSDATAASSFTAQKMREIAQNHDVNAFSLFQPSKISGTPADEIRSYNAAKGSGAISQSVSVMLGMWRPGYNPQDPENDKFTSISCLKNRMGPLFSLDFGWKGRSGTIATLTDDERAELKQIRDKKKEAESASSSNSGW